MIYPIYSAGRFTEGELELEVMNPYTGFAFASTYRATDSHLEESIVAAEAVTGEMRQMPSYMKSDILKEIALGIEENAEELSVVLSMESGKPLKYSSAEVLRAVNVFRIAAEESRRLPKEYISLDWTPVGTGREGLVKYFPVGIVAAISPFNFPLNLAVHKVAPAIAAGCPVILKPASATPLTALLLARIVDQTSLPRGAFSVLPLDRDAGNRMVTDERFALLSFTGSPEVGWKMKSAAGKKRVVLELGGNAGLIITDSANLDKAVGKAVMGAFSYSGQICIHTQRIFVHRSIFDKFTERFLELTARLREGDPADPDTDISVMIDEANARRIEQWVDEAVAQGAKLLAGGRRRGLFYEPTILTNTNPGMKVYSEEAFGPVVTIDPYESFEEAVARINNSRYGLQAGVFTDSLSEVDAAFEKIEAGGVIVNDVPTLRFDHMPYGGIKDSGFGREGIRYAIHDMLEPKVLVK